MAARTRARARALSRTSTSTESRLEGSPALTRPPPPCSSRKGSTTTSPTVPGTGTTTAFRTVGRWPVRGAATVSLLIGTWIMSMLSPLLIVLPLLDIGVPTVWLLSMSLAGALLALVAFMPESLFGGPPHLSRSLRSKISDCLNYGLMRYFKGVEIVYEDPSLVTLAETREPGTTLGSPLLLLVHPHGIFSIGWAILFTRPEFRKMCVRFCFATALCYSPFFRLLCRLTGRFGSASKQSMKKLMKKAEHLALIPGGFHEATISTASADRVYLTSRTGFVSYALQYGYNLVPVFVFGERKLYWNYQGMWEWRLKMNDIGVPAVFPSGSSILPILPRPNNKLKIVVGTQLEMPRIENPTKSDVLYWHQMYIEAVIDLYLRHKDDFYRGDERNGNTKERKKSNSRNILEIW